MGGVGKTTKVANPKCWQEKQSDLACLWQERARACRVVHWKSFPVSQEPRKANRQILVQGSCVRRFVQKRKNNVVIPEINWSLWFHAPFCIEKNSFRNLKFSFGFCAFLSSFVARANKILVQWEIANAAGSDWCVYFSLIVHSLMSSIQLLDRSVGRLFPWVFHAPKVFLGTAARLSGSGALIVFGGQKS